MNWAKDSRLKWTYVTRTIPDEAPAWIGPHPPGRRSGDLVVARVTRIGVHTHAEDRFGRRMRLYPGDFLLGAYGNRYATDLFEGYVPRGPKTHLLTSGGLIGTVASAHDAVGDPTDLEVVGALVDQDRRPLSTETFTRPRPPSAVPRIGTIAVVGSGMNSGKTTAVASIVKGWTMAGLAVGAAKVTGSGSGKDRWSYVDAGAVTVADFLDFGMPSTFGYPLERLEQTMLAIRDALVADGAEVAVLEIADGLLQPETARLAERLRGVADAVVLTAVDALSARSGVEILRGLALPVRAVSGLLTRSPLAAREAATAIGLPMLTPSELAGEAALGLLAPEAVCA